jgi:hypothetical protein
MHDILVKTELLVLRPLRAVDAENLFGLDNDPEGMRFTNGGIQTP